MSFSSPGADARRRLAAALLVVAAIVFPQATPAQICDAADQFAYSDDLSGVSAACLLPPRRIQLEAVYLQNASAVGGTALAAFPLFRVRAGIAPRFELTFDSPSQIAESQPGGGGLWPITHLGYGLNYALRQTPRSALALVTEVRPPTSRFAPSQTQPKYLIGVVGDRTVSRQLTLGAALSGTSSGSVGFERVLPSLSGRAAYRMSSRTEVVTAVGSRIVGRREHAQTFGDIAVEQMLRPLTLFMVGVGTTFNAASNAKAHYLSSGFAQRL